MTRGYPDFEGHKSGLYLKPEWAGKEGQDKNWVCTFSDIAIGDSFAFSYSPPSGKVFYITTLLAVAWGDVAGERDLPQMFEVSLFKAPGTTYIVMGGNGGCGISLTKVIVHPGGTDLLAYARNYSYHVINVRLYVGGYEI